MELWSEKLLASNAIPVLESHVITVSWSNNGSGTANSVKMYPPISSGKVVNLNYQTGTWNTTNIQVEEGYVYRFTVLDTGMEKLSNVGLAIGQDVMGNGQMAFVLLSVAFTGIFPLLNSSGTAQNSMKKGAVGYSSGFSTGSKMVFGLYRIYKTTGETGSTKIQIDKIPKNAIKPKKYCYSFYNTSNYTTSYVWQDTETSPGSSYSRQPAWDVY